jgi:hypothetical protein
MEEETAECSFRLAFCSQDSDISDNNLIKLWDSAAKDAVKAKKSHLAYVSYSKVADIYKLKNEHRNAAKSFEAAFMWRDRDNSSKESLDNYLKLARYSRVQYELDGDNKAASKMFIQEKNTEKLVGNLLEKTILNIHKWTSYYGEMPILVFIYVLLVLCFSSWAYYSYGTSKFCPSAEIVAVSEVIDLKSVPEAVNHDPTSKSRTEKSGLDYELEECNDKFDNVGDSIYMSIVTFTTLGYGEITPVNFVGKLTSILLSILGVLLTSLFMVTFVRKYSRP